MFSEEAIRINGCLEEQKAEHKWLKERNVTLKKERRAVRAEIQEEMRLNKRCQITT